MVPNEARYFLRMESGARALETIPIPASGLTVGRRPENALAIAEPSVSGKHAELLVDGEGVMLRDLGSTNGTRVGADKITEQRLVHGDDVVFGHVKATFLDGRMSGGAAPAASSAPAPPPAGSEADLGEAVRTVGGDRMAKTGKKGMLGLLVLLVVVLGGGAAAFLLLGKGGEEAGGPALIPVVEVAGNQIPDASFEGESATWTSADAAPATFYRGSGFRRSGATGLGAELAPGEWARASSPDVRFRPRRGLALTASLSVEGDAEACVGVELTASAGGRAPFVAWTRALRDPSGFEDVELTVPSLPGYDGARVVVEARAAQGGNGGSVSLDDVALVEADSPAAVATLGDDALFALGQPARTVAVVHATEMMISGLHLKEPAAAEPGEQGPRWSAGTIAASATGNGMRLAFEGVEPDAVLAFTAHPEAPPFLATMGADGFRAYSASFEDVRATSLLFGGGSRLLRLRFEQDVTLKASLGAGGLRVEVALEGARACDLQVSFREERIQANELATRARELARTDAGAGLAAWSRVLDEFPFETRLVEEAEQARTALLSAGHGELGELREDFERARFFGLPDLFRRCGARARDLAERFEGSDVATEARELAAAIETEREQLSQNRSRFEHQRLEAVLGVVEGEEWKGLAQRVRDALDG